MLLDPAIRNWVLIPMVIVMFFVSILRTQVAIYLQEEPKKKASEVVTMQMMLRSRRWRATANLFPSASVAQRKTQLMEQMTQETPVASPFSMMMDPNNVSNMMKKNMTMIIPQIALAAWANFFFEGFVLVKLPFPLTSQFKVMMQRGIELQSLDVSYVSSLSWYVLNLFGLRGLITLVMGEANVVDDAAIMQSQMQMGSGGAAQVDQKKLFAQEKDEWQLLKHSDILDGIEERLLASYQQQCNGRSNETKKSK